MVPPTDPPVPQSGTARTYLAVALAVVAIAAGLPGLDDIGVTWDEVYYFDSVERIQAWAARATSAQWREALSAESIELTWESDHDHNPHPPAYKIGMAVADAIFDDVLGRPASYRLPSLLMLGMLTGLVTWMTGLVAGLGAGLVAGLSVVFMPRLFGHGHIAATDLPLTFFWFAATFGCFMYVRQGRLHWLTFGGLFLGLGMATKFTAFLLPVALVPWLLLRGHPKRSVSVLIGGVLLALVMALVVNPAAWADPIGYQVRLVEESLARDVAHPIGTHYRGRTFGYVVPWDHPVVMSTITIPVAILALAAVGMKTAVRDSRTRDLGLLCVVQVIFWLSLIALPKSPNHDGVRLWLPMFPFVAVAAGLGFEALGAALAGRLPPRATTAGLVCLGALYMVPSFLGTLRSRPYYLSYYSELIAGPSGANRRGMEATYWQDAITRDFIRELHTRLPDSARVLGYPNHVHFQSLQRFGLIRKDLVFTYEPPADYLLLTAKKATFNAAAYDVWSQAQPILSRRLDGVELVGLYSWASVREQLDRDE